MSRIQVKRQRARRFWRYIIIAELTLMLLVLAGFVALNSRGIEELAAKKLFPYVKIMEVTAYTAGLESTGKDWDHPDYGVTASTHRIDVGSGELCIAAPPDIAFGTRIFVPGYGAAMVKDRGSAIQGDCLDIYYDDLEEALQWGRKRMEVVIFP